MFYCAKKKGDGQSLTDVRKGQVSTRSASFLALQQAELKYPTSYK